jgi:hypothetical protein
MRVFAFLVFKFKMFADFGVLLNDRVFFLHQLLVDIKILHFLLFPYFVFN